MTEIWRAVKGYEGLYEVSNLGNVRSLNYRRMGVKRVLSPKPYGDGYLGVNLYDLQRKQHTHYIHRLVAIAFLPNPYDLPQVNHRDENKHNNRIENLEWCTQKYNNDYGTAPQRRGNSLSKPIVQMLNGDVVRVWSSGREAQSDGFNPSKIAQCCQGKQKHHKGYVWLYAI